MAHLFYIHLTGPIKFKTLPVPVVNYVFFELYYNCLFDSHMVVLGLGLTELM
jgi:hypothetical protein